LTVKLQILIHCSKRELRTVERTVLFRFTELLLDKKWTCYSIDIPEQRYFFCVLIWVKHSGETAASEMKLTTTENKKNRKKLLVGAPSKMQYVYKCGSALSREAA
jgi:hypothetical protein